MGDYKQALELYESALQIVNRTFGNTHPDIARILNNLAVIFIKVGRIDEARSNYQKALTIMESIFGKNDKNSQIIRASLNDLEDKLKDQAEQDAPPDRENGRRSIGSYWRGR